MNLPLGRSTVLELDGCRWIIRGGAAWALEGSDPVAGPQFLFTDFGGALQGVEEISASRRYAAAVLEKTLRDRGDTEGACKVLLVQADSRSGATRALYSAVSVDRFEEYSRQAARHGDHCLLLPYTALLAARARRVQDKTAYVLLQHGLHVDLLVTVDKIPHALLRVTASGSGEADWERALRFLIGELGIIQSRLEQAEGSAVWVDWDPQGQGDGATIRRWLEDNSNLRLELEESIALAYEGASFNSSLPSLFPLCGARACVNPLPMLAMYWSERVLPYAVVAFAGLGLALFAAALQWRGQTAELQAEVAAMPGGTAGLDLTAIRQDLQQGGLSESGDKIELVERLYRAHTLPSLAQVIADIRSVIPDNCNLSGLALNRDGEGTRLIVEGWIDAEPTAVNLGIEALIHSLGELGYPVRDNGLLALKQRDMFQLELILDEGLNEI